MAKKQLLREEMLLSPQHPQWLDTIILNRYCDESLYKIILFFVIFSPCPKYCTQGRTLQYYHWKEKPWTTNRYLKDRLDDGIFSDRKKYFRCVERISELAEAVHKAELEDDFYLHREIERVAFINTAGNEYMSLFHHIRCALAHGRIAMFEDNGGEDIVFVMENGVDVGADFHVKARMVLRKGTLLKWIDVITTGPQEAERNYRYEVYKALLNNKRLRIKDLTCMFKETEYCINKAIDFLKKAKILTYCNHGKNSWWEVNVTNAQACFENISISS